MLQSASPTCARSLLCARGPYFAFTFICVKFKVVMQGPASCDQVMLLRWGSEEAVAAWI